MCQHPLAPGPTPRAARLQEDEAILELVAEHGAQKWAFIASQLPGRIGKQCRERCVLAIAPMPPSPAATCPAPQNAGQPVARDM